MIDRNGYRHNVGIVLCNEAKQVLVAKRDSANAWQFPQGGIRHNESTTEALFRELEEEIGLKHNQVELIARTATWLYYDIPTHLQRKKSNAIIGQKQLWFLLKIKCDDNQICLDNHHIREFDEWCWTDYWQPIDIVIGFKQSIYEDALKALAPILFDNCHSVPTQYKRPLNCSAIRLIA